MTESNDGVEESMTNDTCIEMLKDFVKAAKNAQTDLGDKLVKAEKALEQLRKLLGELETFIDVGGGNGRCEEGHTRAFGGA